MTEQTFKVGDRVNHHGMRKGVLTYGPFESVNGGTTFLLKQEDGRERVAHVDYLTAIPAFAVGDKAHDSDGIVVDIVAGPFKGYSEWYAVKNAHGQELQANADSLKALPAPEPIKVGTRVRVLEASGIPAASGKLGTVHALTERPGRLRVELDEPWGVGTSFRRLYADRWEVAGDAITVGKPFTLRGITYDLNARYEDTDGDVWRFAVVNHTVRGEMGSGASTIDQHSKVIAEVVDDFGPLRKL